MVFMTVRFRVPVSPGHVYMCGCLFDPNTQSGSVLGHDISSCGIEEFAVRFAAAPVINILAPVI